jgi:IS605 OrfB family transposase
MKKKNKDILIRSTKASIKFSNCVKKTEIEILVDNYRYLVEQFTDILWGMEKVPQLLGKDIVSRVDRRNLSARLVQCAGKQASGIVRGTRTKQKRRLWKINDFKKQGMFKKARKLQKIYDEVKCSKPDIKNVELELDERFVKQDFDNETSFDGWITISSIGQRKKITLPIKRTKHFNKLLKKGTLKKGIRLSKKSITFNFGIEKPKVKETGDTLGIDIGKINTISCSNGIQTKENNHGQTLGTIIDDLAKKTKGSKAFERKQRHRLNFINWSINQLNLEKCKQVNIEKIKYLRKGKRTNRKMQGWTYTDIFSKIKDKCINQGVLVNELNPTYTSQRCSVCGRVRKANRKGKLFKCDNCNTTIDADLNASLNISLNLPQIPKKIRLKNLNRKGFYWLKSGFYLDSDGQEHIIPDTRKTSLHDSSCHDYM